MNGSAWANYFWVMTSQAHQDMYLNFIQMRKSKGSAFAFEFIFSVYEKDEDNLMGVFEAMRLLEDNYLGGSGSRGFGKVKFTNISITKRGQDYYKKDMDEEVIIENADISEAVKSIN